MCFGKFYTGASMRLPWKKTIHNEGVVAGNVQFLKGPQDDEARTYTFLR